MWFALNRGHKQLIEASGVHGPRTITKAYEHHSQHQHSCHHCTYVKLLRPKLCGNDPMMRLLWRLRDLGRQAPNDNIMEQQTYHVHTATRHACTGKRPGNHTGISAQGCTYTRDAGRLEGAKSDNQLKDKSRDVNAEQPMRLGRPVSRLDDSVMTARELSPETPDGMEPDNLLDDSTSRLERATHHR